MLAEYRAKEQRFNATKRITGKHNKITDDGSVPWEDSINTDLDRECAAILTGDPVQETAPEDEEDADEDEDEDDIIKPIETHPRRVVDWDIPAYDLEIDGSGFIRVTKEFVHAGGTSPFGSWTAKQLHLLGISWPPRSGWLRTIEGKRLKIEHARQFLALGRTRRDKLINKIKHRKSREEIA